MALGVPHGSQPAESAKYKPVWFSGVEHPGRQFGWEILKRFLGDFPARSV
jgi:hypothetical protein